VGVFFYNLLYKIKKKSKGLTQAAAAKGFAPRAWIKVAQNGKIRLENTLSVG
jgi:hypothetical protein